MATVSRPDSELGLSLAPVLARIERALDRASGRLDEAARHLFRAGGKQIRPLLVLLSAQAAQGASTIGQGPDDAAFDVAAAVEMIHVASLIHDDVIDQAESRRAVPAVNARWDNHTAVLAGDYLFASAFGILARYADLGLVDLMTAAIRRMCEGEILQREQAHNPDLTEEEYLERVNGKTAALLSAACQAGARLAGAEPDRAASLGEYGLFLGLAYQVIDDVLDLEGNGAQMGKATGSDLRQGVITLPVIHLLSEPQWKAAYGPHIARGTIGEEMLAEIRLAARACGATERARLEGMRLAQRALASLSPLYESASRSPAAFALDTMKRLCREAVERNR